jgi:hypothetical protein
LLSAPDLAPAYPALLKKKTYKVPAVWTVSVTISVGKGTATVVNVISTHRTDFDQPKSKR